MHLELHGVTKRFGSLVANDNVSLVVEPGQIHCLLGENGAGKSTLMNVLFGLLHPDDGDIIVNGEKVRFADSGEAVRRGIGMVHQHFMLVPVFSVAENVVLGFEPTHNLGFLDHNKAREDIRRVSSEFGLEIDPDATVEDLPIGLQQRVEILKALNHDAELLILDEPTAVLTPQEIDALFVIMKSLTASGKSILFITHKLKEVKAVADTITVLRGGRVVGTASPKDSESELASLMVTLGATLLLYSAMTAIFGTEIRRFPPAVLDSSSFELAGIRLSLSQILIVGSVILLVLLFIFLLRATRIGLAMRALAENGGAAQLMGVDTDAVMRLVSFLSGMAGGAAGILMGLNYNAIQPYMGEAMMLKGFAVIIFGGLGDIRGALVAGLLIGIFEALTAGYISSVLKEAVAFLLLVLTLWIRPLGMFGQAAVKRA